ncbi:MAG: amino acid-binding protein [Gammaproteobacteria bacterium]|nr:amino acid-binding protein [Gammaproteobacteria bacterium]
MNNWFMLTLVGKDRPGIVAKISTVLYEGGANLGAASMQRLGDCFTIMLMVNMGGTVEELEAIVKPAAESLRLCVHTDSIEEKLHEHQEPDVCVSVYGADRAGIVAQVTSVLAEAGLNILELESDLGGSEEKPFYITHIEGVATNGMEALTAALKHLKETHGRDIETRLTSIDTVIG